MIVKKKIDVSRFFLALLFWVAASVPVDSAGDQRKEAAGQSAPTNPVKIRQYVTWADYAITRMTFLEFLPGTNKQDWVKKCVFHPIYPPNVLPQESQANITQSALNQLKSYRVYRRDGQLLNHKYGPFAIAATDLPRFFAAADVLPEGCGDFLLTGDGKVVTGKPPGDLDAFIQMFKGDEERLFTAALRRLPEWVTDEERQAIAKDNLNDIYARSKKSDVGTFYDGHAWYLVRSYWTRRPTTVSLFVLYEIDFTQSKLVPRLASLSPATGLGAWGLEYFGALDLNHDEINELIVELSGHEYSYFTYLRREADGWRFR